jgi:hypothetical protein
MMGTHHNRCRCLPSRGDLVQIVVDGRREWSLGRHHGRHLWEVCCLLPIKSVLHIRYPLRQNGCWIISPGRSKRGTREAGEILRATTTTRHLTITLGLCFGTVKACSLQAFSGGMGGAMVRYYVRRRYRRCFGMGGGVLLSGIPSTRVRTTAVEGQNGKRQQRQRLTFD